MRGLPAAIIAQAPHPPPLWVLRFPAAGNSVSDAPCLSLRTLVTHGFPTGDHRPIVSSESSPNNHRIACFRSGNCRGGSEPWLQVMAGAPRWQKRTR